MKNSKYTYKNRIPKTLGRKQKRPIGIKKRNKVKQKSMGKESNKPLRKSPNINRQPSMWTYISRIWKLPSFLIIISLIVVILIIPTVIVLPFAMDQGSIAELEVQDSVVETMKSTEGEKASSLSVAVMRTNSDEVENVPLETYVARVVASEMPVEFEVEALKAQALAARTYIINHLIHQEDLKESNITDATDHQVYNSEEELQELYGVDFTWKMNKLTEAVKATEGMILTYENKPITPAYFSTSNGYTENSEDYWENELPYLRSVESPWDEDSPQFLDQQIFNIKSVADALSITLPNQADLRISMNRTDSNRVSQLTIGNHKFTGRDVREKLSLKSSDFEVKQKNDHLIFTTKGFGHGIGMSQYGANGLAKEGKSYEEIVKYYYKDVDLSPITETAPTLVLK